MCLNLIQQASSDNALVNDWAWVAPLASFVVGLIGGAILLWNNRQRPHDVLKTYVEIYNDLPEGETKDRLWSEIGERLLVLTTPRDVGRIGQSREEVPIREELRTRRISLATFAIVALISAGLAVVLGMANSYTAAEIVMFVGVGLAAVVPFLAILNAAMR